jgi:hypothetical protein
MTSGRSAGIATPVETASVLPVDPTKPPSAAAAAGEMPKPPPPLKPMLPRSAEFEARKPRLTDSVAFTCSLTRTTAPVWNVTAFMVTASGVTPKAGSATVEKSKRP